ncbi:MAG: SUMF1/EgtB/PvdO family nonheme iron enzyme [Planctomycetaceae bacterium]|nr:SUMF1/EgtB/PvdO family nonheme iron enzyme [Planctomycetaceae bacterium]
MHGNVWEWCKDWHDNYPSGSVTDPTGANNGSYRVLRGGCWYDFAERCRSANRIYNTPTGRYFSLGLRLSLVDKSK